MAIVTHNGTSPKVIAIAAMLLATPAGIRAQSGSPSRVPPTATVHPQEEYIVRAAPISSRWDLSARSVRKLPIRDARPLWTFGVVGSRTDGEIGTVTDVTLASDGTVYVLDDELDLIHIFDSTGVRRVHRRARRGRMRPPSAITVDGTSVYVASAPGEVDQYRRTRDHALEYVGTLIVDGSPTDICTTGGGVYAQVVSANHSAAVSRAARAGRRPVTFGGVYRHPDVVARVSVGRARIACAAETVVIAPTSLIPEISAYGLNGEGKWTVKVDRYRAVTAESPAVGILNVRMPEGGFHRLHSLSLLSPHSVLVQIATVMPPKPREGTALEVVGLSSAIVRIADGAVQTLSASMPPIVAANERWLVSVPLGSAAVQMWRHAAQDLP